MDTAAKQKTGNTLLQRVTRMLTRTEAAPVQAPEPEVKPVESEEKRLARLEAYRQFCEDEAKKGTGAESLKKGFKYRAPDFNS